MQDRVEIYRRVERQYIRDRLGDMGLQAVDGMVVGQLAREGQLRQEDMVHRLVLDKGAVARSVARLEELGLVELPEEGGKRRYRAKLRLTEAGRAAAERMTGKIRQAVQRGGRGLTDGQREDFYRALGVIARNLEQICSTEEPI